MKFVATQTACLEEYIGETSQPLQHRHEQLCQAGYNQNDSTVFKYVISCGHQMDVNDGNLGLGEKLV